MSTPDDLGRLVRDRRKTLGMSQGDLAARVGVTRQWVGFLEAGRPRAELGLVLATLNSLGLKLDAFPSERVVQARRNVRPVDLDQVLADTLEDDK